MEIIAGKWYKNTNWDFCKATGVAKDDYIYFNEKIRSGKFEKQDNFWPYLSTCVEAEYEEYGKYLPDGHPDKRESRKIEDMSVELVNFPSEGYCESTNDKFKKGDYIVTLDVTIDSKCARNDFCFKQREDGSFIKPEIDLKDSKTNSHCALTFDKSEGLEDWRYATKDEIEIYNELKKPFDVTALPKVGNYITVTHNDDDDGEKIICKYTRRLDALRCYGPRLSNFDYVVRFTFNNDLGVCFIGDDRKYRPSTDEEIAWLDACVENDGVVELIDFKTCAGRIVKAKRNRPYNIPIKIGEYGILDGGEKIKLSDSLSIFNFDFGKNTFYRDFEIMPEGFTLPESKEKPKEELKMEPEYKVVECKSQAEWDFVTKKIGYSWREPRFDYCNYNCINFQQKSRGTLALYKRYDSLIYSFDEWCKEFNHTFDKSDGYEGVEYVELLCDLFGFMKGDIAKIVNRIDTEGFYIFVPNRTSTSNLKPNVYAYKTYINPSTKAAYDKQHATVMSKVSTVKTYQLFIEKTQAKPVVADKPINLIKTRKLQINLAD